MKKIFLLLIITLPFLTSCAGTSVSRAVAFDPITGPVNFRIDPESHRVPVRAMDIFEAKLTSLLKEKGMLSDSPQSNIVNIKFKNYYVRHGATRFFAGIMAGRDQILSDVTVKDPAGNKIAEFEVNSTNPSAWGTSSGLIEDHAEKIVNQILLAD